jgi:hypothetical protein
MAADTPLNRLVLSAASVADDLGYVALADLAHALGAVTADYRIIGGHMVTMLAGRWQLGAELYRETGDVDLGVPPIVARDYNVVDRLKDLGYTQVAGNRFARRLSDVPLRLAGGENPQPEVFIDVLVPAYTSRARQNVAITEHLFTTEVPGLSIALARAPATLALEMHRLNGMRRPVHRGRQPLLRSPLRLGNRLEPGITHFSILSGGEVSALPPGPRSGPACPRARARSLRAGPVPLPLTSRSRFT